MGDSGEGEGDAISTDGRGDDCRLMALCVCRADYGGYGGYEGGYGARAAPRGKGTALYARPCANYRYVATARGHGGSGPVQVSVVYAERLSSHAVVVLLTECSGA